MEKMYTIDELTSEIKNEIKTNPDINYTKSQIKNMIAEVAPQSRTPKKEVNGETLRGIELKEYCLKTPLLSSDPTIIPKIFSRPYRGGIVKYNNKTYISCRTITEFLNNNYKKRYFHNKKRPITESKVYKVLYESGFKATPVFYQNIDEILFVYNTQDMRQILNTLINKLKLDIGLINRYLNFLKGNL